jgi:hypothetical protein
MENSSNSLILPANHVSQYIIPSITTRFHKVYDLLELILFSFFSLGVVLFDSSIDVLLPLTKMDAGGKDRASQLIKTIKERGSTDLSGGLLKGLDLLRTRAQ